MGNLKEISLTNAIKKLNKNKILRFLKERGINTRRQFDNLNIKTFLEKMPNHRPVHTKPTAASFPMRTAASNDCVSGWALFPRLSRN